MHLALQLVVLIPYKFTLRRAGDIASYYSNPEKAWQELKWKAEKTLLDMAKDSWNWQSKTLMVTKRMNKVLSVGH